MLKPSNTHLSPAGASLVRRSNLLLHDLLIVDGQSGCGKSLFSAVLAAMDRIELLNYSTEIENLCGLYYLGKITGDAAQAMIQIQADQILYETMMGRRTNFRLSDVSCALRDTEALKYLKRLFSRGDEVIPDRVAMEKPILHFATHNLLAFSEPIFWALTDRIKIVEVVRHPLYMIIQQTLHNQNYFDPKGNLRRFHIAINHNNTDMPFWNRGCEESYLSATAIERSVGELARIHQLTENKKAQGLESYANQIVTIPFEHFAINPYPFLSSLETLLGTRITKKTRRALKKQNVPRAKFSEGIPLAIYKRCGWEPPTAGYSERDELLKRRDFVKRSGANVATLATLDSLSAQYEERYLTELI
jgi:hypothetical protein